MFCNECGNQNKDGAKFCVHCGAALKQPEAAAVTSAAYKMPNISGNSFNTVKKFILPLVILILVIIAGVNILSARMNIFSVDTYNDEQTATRGTLVETGSYIYCTADGLVRIDKSTYETEKITNKSLDIVAATRSGIYCVDSDNNALYAVKDSSNELEKFSGSVYSSDKFFISGKNNYVLSTNGELTKRLNSKKGITNYTKRIHEKWDDCSLMTVKQYKDYLYITRMIGTSITNADYDFVRISLSDGKEDVLCSEYITYFDFTDNTIVYKTSDNTIHTMSLNGSDDKEIVDIEAKNFSTFLCYNNCIYYYSKGNCKYDLSNATIEELPVTYSGLQQLNSCLAYYTNSIVYLYDYNGNEIRTTEL